MLFSSLQLERHINNSHDDQTKPSVVTEADESSGGFISSLGRCFFLHYLIEKGVWGKVYACVESGFEQPVKGGGKSCISDAMLTV